MADLFMYRVLYHRMYKIKISCVVFMSDLQFREALQGCCSVFMLLCTHAPWQVSVIAMF